MGDKNMNSEIEYEVEEIVDAKYVNNKIEFLVKWKDYSSSDNSWKQLKNLANCNIKLEKYIKKRYWRLFGDRKTKYNLIKLKIPFYNESQ